jgi:hypothetical protein
VSGGGFVGTGDGQAEAGHVGVDGFVFSGGDLVGFVPDADGVVVADVLVEGLPCGEVGGVTGLGVVDELVEAAPVLGDHDAGPVDGGEAAEEAQGRVGVELAEHGAHRFADGEPFVDGEEAVDAKADEENDEGAFDVGGVSACVDGRHVDRMILIGTLAACVNAGQVRALLEGPHLRVEIWRDPAD